MAEDPNGQPGTTMDVISQFIFELAALTQALPPQDQGYPQSLLLLASANEASRSLVRWVPLIRTDIPGRPDGWVQALSTSRDLLTLLTQLNDDYKLGLQLDAALRSHPLFGP